MALEKWNDTFSVTINKDNVIDNKEIANNGNLIFSGDAYNGEPVERWYGILGIDLTNAKLLTNSTKILWNHEEDSLALGKSDVVIDNQIKIVRGEIYNESDIKNAKGVIAQFNNNHPIQLSMGISGELLFLETMEQRLINGKLQIVDCIMQNITLKEISIVNTPADGSTFAVKMNAGNNELLNINKKHDVERLKQLSKGKSNMTIEHLQSQVTTLSSEKQVLLEQNKTLNNDVVHLQQKLTSLEQDKTNLANQIEVFKRKERINHIKDKFKDYNINNEAFFESLATFTEEQIETQLETFKQIKSNTNRNLMPNANFSQELSQKEHNSNKNDAEQVSLNKLKKGLDKMAQSNVKGAR